MSKKAEAKARKKAAARLSPYYLEHVKATSFGRFANLIVGPFGPGLNVVLGANEAGKTTINELVKGVLFGWPIARGSVNSYKPALAERAGSLFFRDLAQGEVVEVSRTKNAEGAEDAHGLLRDIDRDTYQTMFALTSDELMRLDRHNDVTARLLTAGSGTAASPAHALEAINTSIRETASRASDKPHSIANLLHERDRLRAQTQAGLEASEESLAQSEALAALQPRRETLSRTQEQLNAEIEKLTVQAERLRALAQEAQEADEAQARAHDAAEAARARLAESAPEEISEIVELDQAEEHRLSDALDAFDDERAKLERAVDNARSEANKSCAEYEVLMEDSQANERKTRARASRAARIALAILIPLCMVAAGGYVLYHLLATEGLRLSYLAAGAALVVFALIIAVAGALIGAKPSKVEERLDDQRKKVDWVMQQDRKNLEACERDLADHVREVEMFLFANGLIAAHGSTRRARRIVDQAREWRAAQGQDEQQARALELQAAALKQDAQRARSERRELCRSMGLPEGATQDEAQELITRKGAERTATAKLAQETDRQIGELTQKLAAARDDAAFDAAKFAEEVNRAQLEEAYRSLAVLLLARKGLEASIAEWERKSQPAVYALASDLFSQMTDGAWETVRMNAAGEIEVVDAVRTVRNPNLLSLGTRQQLYLALRIALLMTADNVGRGLPILCDDILVNFDPARRLAATRALARLARRRQVILFTCHPDVAALVQKVDSKATVLEL